MKLINSSKIKIDNKGVERITRKISESLISQYPIYGERINLRPLQITDTSTIIKWRNDVDIKKWMINQDSISKESHIAWFNSRKNRFDFIIEENKSNKAIGTLNLKLTSKSEAELGKLIGEKFFTGKGYANESSNLLINFAFNNLYLKKLFAYTKTTNQKNIKLNKKLGFKIEQEMKINSNQVYKMCLKTMFNNQIYIIAELSANHLGDKNIAIKTIKEIAESGANAVKVQTFKPESLTLNLKHGFFQPRKEGLWKGYTPWELYSKASLPYEWHYELKEIANSLNLDFFSTPFDFEAVDFLMDLDVPMFKVSISRNK